MKRQTTPLFEAGDHVTYDQPDGRFCEARIIDRFFLIDQGWLYEVSVADDQLYYNVPESSLSDW